ncbi:hypothetical protein RhiirA4_551285, partial [Rhizophagus irregularis]
MILTKILMILMKILKILAILIAILTKIKILRSNLNLSEYLMLIQVHYFN